MTPPTMADPLRTPWWQQENLAAIKPKPATSDLRPCGCHWDTVVFSHYPGPMGGGCGGGG